MSDTSIPTHGGARPECPDCYHAPHFRTGCKQQGCGCPSGIERKRERDADVQAGKGDSARNTQPGFF